MFSTIRRFRGLRFLWFILAIQIFNISIDPPDLQADSVRENLSINELESVVEIILENILDFKNAISEYDEDDDQNSNNLSKVGFQLYCNYGLQLRINPTLSSSNVHLISYNSKLKVADFFEIQSPPPEC